MRPFKDAFRDSGSRTPCKGLRKRVWRVKHWWGWDCTVLQWDYHPQSNQAVRAHASVPVWVGVQKISFECLIWSKVAQDAAFFFFFFLNSPMFVSNIYKRALGEDAKNSTAQAERTNFFPPLRLSLIFIFILHVFQVSTEAFDANFQCKTTTASP